MLYQERNLKFNYFKYFQTLKKKLRSELKVGTEN